MKKNRLYTVSSWNKPAFMQGSVFWPGGSLTLGDQGNFFQHQGGGLYGDTTGDNSRRYMTPVQGISPTDTINGLQNDLFKRAAAFKPQIKTDTSKPQTVTIKPSTMQAVGMGLSAIGDIPTGDRRGLWDTLDPVYHIAGGRESGVGNTMSDVGIGLTKAGLQSGNVPLMIAGAGAKILGGLTNAAFGIKTDKEKLATVNNNINANKNFVSNASSFDNVIGPAARVNTNGVFSGGWFSKGKAKDKQEELDADALNAYLFADRSVQNNINNLVDNQTSEALRNYSAFGGPLDVAENNNDMSAINYGFMQDYLLNKKREVAAKNKMSGMTSLPAFMPNSFAIGGDLQMNGADWTNGTMHIDAGGSHESNPYEGIQIGKDESGTPNLVEEGERIFNDYVYSKRIFADGGTLEKFHLSKKRKISFADLAELLEKESKERPNDSISQAGLKAQMSQLADEQERQKQEMEAERAKAAFDALRPEEQTALMQQRAEQEAMAQQAAIQEAAAMQSTEQPTPEEAAMMQQQQVMADGSESNLGQLGENHYIDDGAVAMANGGRIVRAGDVEPNKFAIGGRKAKRAIKKYNEDWFRQMAKSLGISDEEMKSFKFTNDPEANLTAFNNIYRNNQYEKAKKIYTEGQRQSKRNELFGDKGLYSYSDDKSKIYKARTNDADRTGWINKDYTGAVDSDGNMLGFLSQEDYDKLKPEEKEAYRRINEKAGDRMYDYNGRVIRDLYNGTEEKLLNSFDADYAKGFKWDDKDAQTLQYPVDMEHSATSAMRYIPAIGGAIGLGYNLLSSPDYSRPQAIIDAARSTSIPEQIQPRYVGNYLTYRPMDIWYQQNALNAQSRATDRQLVNNSGGNRGTAMAGLLANGYNSQIASGNLYRQALEYNDALRQKVEDFNRGTNIFNANADMDAQKTNAMLRQQAGRLGLQGLMTGYGMMDDIDARRQASMNANLTNVLQSLGNIGEEAYDEDRLKWLERTGTLKSRTLGADGGKLKKKKRGLTI